VDDLQASLNCQNANLTCIFKL